MGPLEEGQEKRNSTTKVFLGRQHIDTKQEVSSKLQSVSLCIMLGHSTTGCAVLAISARRTSYEKKSCEHFCMGGASQY